MINFSKQELGIIFTNLAVNERTREVLKKIIDVYDKCCEHKYYKLRNKQKCFKCGDVIND